MGRPKMSPRRKIAIASYKVPKEGNILGELTVDATAALAYLEWVRETTGERATITTLVGKAVATALAEEPTLNGRITFGAFRPYKTVDISFLVALEEGADLAQAKIAEADTKSVAEITRHLRERAERLRARQAEDFEKSLGIVRILPTWILRPMLWFTGFVNTGLGIPLFGQKAVPFGAGIITSVGMFGLDKGFAPPTPFCRVPLYVLVGSVVDRPWVVDGRVAVRPLLTVTATIDHRFIDGYQGGVLARAFRRVFDNPWSLEGMEGPPAPKPARRAPSRPRKATVTRR